MSTPEIIYKVQLNPQDGSGRVHKGRVCVEATVATDGTLKDITTILRTDQILEKNLREALRQWRYRPATKDGVPVEYRLNIETEVH